MEHNYNFNTFDLLETLAQKTLKTIEDLENLILHTNSEAKNNRNLFMKTFAKDNMIETPIKVGNFYQF